MKNEVRVPEVSEGIKEGIVAAISVAVGDSVEAEQTLMELETDKAVVEIPSPHAGKVAEIKVKEGETVEIGSVFMLIEAEKDDSEPSDDAGKEGQKKAAEKESESKKTVEKESEPKDKEEKEPDEKKLQTDQPDKPKPESSESSEPESKPAKDEADLETVRRGEDVAPAAPSVRRKARELGVDIYKVKGTGPGGRISKEDIRSYVRETMRRIGAGHPAASATTPLPDFSRWGNVRDEPLSRIRQVTAETMSAAWTTIPMVAQTGQARIAAFEQFRKEFNGGADSRSKLTMTALLVKICAAALRQFPRFNSSLDLANNRLFLKDYVHIGVAVDTPSGLLVPVLQDADKKDIETIATELNDLATRARERKLKPAEMEGGCFTISNLGGIGRDAFTPIVLPPQVAILGVARGRYEPIWNGQDFVPELVLPLTLTYDHRVIDGADGARFMQWICQAIGYPLQLVMKG